MAVVHTDLPSGDGHEGERRFAEALGSILGDKVHLWFGVDHLPGVGDIDAIIAIPQVGIFVLEVKAVGLEAVQEYGLGICRIRNRHGTKTPLKQARSAQIQLVQYLRDVAQIQRPPFFFVTSAWPRISRSEFVARWPGPGVAAQAEGMVFAEDFESEASLIAVLKRAIARPPLGGAPDHRPELSQRDIEAVRGAISPRATVEPTIVDVERMKVVEANTRKRRKQYLEPGDAKEVLFRGKPGTGKTFRLLEIAIGHARGGRNALFACYNMVLAAELRRMLLLDSQAREMAGAIDVVDVFQLLGRYAWDNSDFEAGSYNTSATRMVSRLTTSQAPLDTYGTVLVDEAQDLEPWMHDLLRWHAEPRAEWFVAEGIGQALYRDEPAAWLRDFAERAKQTKAVENLRRVFRTSKADFFVAQCTYERSPDVSGVSGWLAAHPFRPTGSTTPRREDHQFEFDLGDVEFVDDDFDRIGTAPTLSNMPVLAETLSAAAYRSEVVKVYAELIAEELDLLGRIEAPGDLAILVPRTRKWSAMGERVCDALELLGVEYLDQVDDSHAKRRPLPAQTVRVVTYHSARGIEAARVMLMGLEELGRKVGGTEQRIKNLAYVALSRAKHGTRIVVPAERTGPHLDFVKAMIGRLADEIETPALPTGELATQPRDDPRWLRGEIARLVPDRGFGFLAGPESDHFFHVNSLFDIEQGELEVGLKVEYAIESTSDSPRATFVCRAVPAALSDPPEDGRVGALVVEPIGDRGFGFLLSPSVSGRIFFHFSSLDDDGRPDRGTRVDAMVEVDEAGRPRATRIRTR